MVVRGWILSPTCVLFWNWRKIIYENEETKRIHNNRHKGSHCVSLLFSPWVLWGSSSIAFLECRCKMMFSPFLQALLCWFLQRNFSDGKKHKARTFSAWTFLKLFFKKNKHNSRCNPSVIYIHFLWKRLRETNSITEKSFPPSQQTGQEEGFHWKVSLFCPQLILKT